MSDPESPLLNAALAYAQRGLSVIPCHTPRPSGCSCGKPDCAAVGKHPRLRGYRKAATAEPARIHFYWSEYPDANVAIATGAVSGLVVLDVDPRHGGDASLRALETQHGPLPDTPQVLTGGGGVQLYFLHPCLPGLSIPSRANVLGPGLDIRADGGYVIAPPSVHASGRSYMWEVCHELRDTPIAPLPNWLLASLCQPRETPKAQTQQKRASKSPQTGEVFLLARSAMQTFPLPPRRWTSSELTALLGRADVVTRCLPRLQLGHVVIGKKFRCLFHRDEHPSVAILAPRDEYPDYRYVEFHGAQESWPLPLIYWATVTGQAPERMPAPSLLVWTCRLLVDAGVLAPAVLPDVPVLPEDAPAAARRLFAGFRHLLGCRWLYKEAPAPFTWRFASAWCGVSQYMVGMGLKWLLRTGYLVGAGVYEGLQVFLLGTADRVRRLARRVMHAVRHPLEAVADVVQTFRRRTSSTDEGRLTWEALQERQARLVAAKVEHASCRGCEVCEIAIPAQERLLERLRRELEAHGPP